MDLAIKATSGPLKDQVFQVAADLTVGRQGNGIVIDDNKVSSMHARVAKTPEGEWVLQDNNSKNGIRLQYEGERVDAVVLKPGVEFFIGESGFTVLEIVPEKPAKKPVYWYDALADFLEKEGGRFKDRPKPMTPLEPALVLEFVRGVQVNSKWTLGYGPRKIGSASLDLPIFEPGAPAICFEIALTSDGILFKTNHSDIVTLNGQEVDSQVLRMGDTIKIMETLIEVDFIE